jgi:hypothetical protein
MMLIFIELSRNGQYCAIIGLRLVEQPVSNGAIAAVPVNEAWLGVDLNASWPTIPEPIDPAKCKLDAASSPVWFPGFGLFYS